MKFFVVDVVVDVVGPKFVSLGKEVIGVVAFVGGGCCGFVAEVSCCCCGVVVAGVVDVEKVVVSEIV